MGNAQKLRPLIVIVFLLLGLGKNTFSHSQMFSRLILGPIKTSSKSRIIPVNI